MKTLLKIVGIGAFVLMIVPLVSAGGGHGRNGLRSGPSLGCGASTGCGYDSRQMNRIHSSVSRNNHGNSKWYWDDADADKIRGTHQNRWGTPMMTREKGMQSGETSVGVHQYQRRNGSMGPQGVESHGNR